MALLGSGSTHCFLSEQIAQLAGLHLDMRSKLDIHLADEKKWACLGVAHKVHVIFFPWDYTVLGLLNSPLGYGFNS